MFQLNMWAERKWRKHDGTAQPLHARKCKSVILEATSSWKRSRFTIKVEIPFSIISASEP